jgi:hypothetical protein
MTCLKCYWNIFWFVLPVFWRGKFWVHRSGFGQCFFVVFFFLIKFSVVHWTLLWRFSKKITCSLVSAKNLYYEHPLWKYARVSKRGRTLALFDPVIGLVEFWHHLTEAKSYHKREVTSSVTLCKCTFWTCKFYCFGWKQQWIITQYFWNYSSCTCTSPYVVASICFTAYVQQSCRLCSWFVEVSMVDNSVRYLPIYHWKE